jgi:hypothetical protein
LSRWANAFRLQQEPVPAGHPPAHPDRLVLLPRRPRPRRQRHVLQGYEPDDGRHLLRGSGRPEEPHAMSSAQARASMRGRLYRDAGWKLLQQSPRRRRRQSVQSARASLSARPVSQRPRHLCADSREGSDARDSDRAAAVSGRPSPQSRGAVHDHLVTALSARPNTQQRRGVREEPTVLSARLYTQPRRGVREDPTVALSARPKTQPGGSVCSGHAAGAQAAGVQAADVQAADVQGYSTPAAVIRGAGRRCECDIAHDEEEKL